MGFSRIFRIILLKKIHGICLQLHGPGPWAPAHESTGLIKQRSLVDGSTTQIKTRERVSDNLIVAVNAGMDGSQRLGWQRRRDHGGAPGLRRWLTGIRCYRSSGSPNFTRYSPKASWRRGDLDSLTLGWRWRLATARRLGASSASMAVGSGAPSAKPRAPAWASVFGDPFEMIDLARAAAHWCGAELNTMARVSIFVGQNSS
jgi:hypothetical protein